MTNEKKFDLITRNLEEVLTQEDLRYFLEKNIPLKHYIGFELSGQVHLGTGLISIMKVRDFMDAGISTSIFLADWHTWINDKLGGDIKIIQDIGVNYFKESFKACMKCINSNAKKLKFILGTDLYHHNDKYWETMIDVAKHTNLARIQRSITILGRKEGETVDFAKLIYPVMQVADIFAQSLTIAHAGIDQRKAHVVMRDVADKLTERVKKSKVRKPIALHHHLILGLGKPIKWPIEKIDQEFWSDMKMSKSKPGSAIFIHDKPEEIEKKVNNAFCPEGETNFNPVLDWTKHLIFPIRNRLKITREEKFGGNVEYDNFKDLENDFKNKKLHPKDLKKALSQELIDILTPAREHFSKGKNKKLLEEMKQLTITR